MTISTRIFCALIGYAIGCISPAYVLAKVKGYDIKKVGSGNAGTTNVMRSFGKTAGIIVFVLDFVKSIIACYLCYRLFGTNGEDVGNLNKLVIAYAAFGVICGHCFPFYLKFSGGKGVVVTLASMLMIDPIAALFALAVFIIVVVVSRYVSLGSVIATLAFYVMYLIFNTTGTFSFTGVLTETGYGNESTKVVLVIMLIIIAKHKENIVRIIKRKERRIHFHKKHKK